MTTTTTTTIDTYNRPLAAIVQGASGRGRSWMRSDECIGIATHCSCCGHKLKDANSVQIAMGPDCRARLGYDMTPTNPNWYAAKTISCGNGVPLDAVKSWEDAREVCNLLLHIYALDAEHQAWCVDAVHALGYIAVADRMAERRDAFIARAKKREEQAAAEAAAKAAKAKARGWKRGMSFTAPTRAPEPQEVMVTVSTVTDCFRGRTQTRQVFTVKAPYSPAFNAQPVAGRWFDRGVKAWRVPTTSKQELWSAIQASFPGLPLTNTNEGKTTTIPGPKATV